MGLTFKENCPDLRNTRVIDIVGGLQSYHVNVDVYDPWVDSVEAEHQYGLKPVEEPERGVYGAIILAVAHQQFRELGAEGIRAFGKAGACILYDVKHVLPVSEVDGRL